MSSETVDDKNISMPPEKYVHQKMARKEGYLRDAKTQIELAETYLKDVTGKYGDKDVFKTCEKAIDYMDSFLQEDYSNLEDKPQSVFHKEFSMFKSYICELRNKKSSYELQDCVEGIKRYLEFFERIKELAGWRFEDVFFLQKKEACYMQISDLLLEMGEFPESKRYSDLTKQLFSSNI